MDPFAVRLEAKGCRHFWGNLEGGDDVQEGVLGRGTACQNQSTRVRESGRVMGHEDIVFSEIGQHKGQILHDSFLMSCSK